MLQRPEVGLQTRRDLGIRLDQCPIGVGALELVPERFLRVAVAVLGDKEVQLGRG